MFDRRRLLIAASAAALAPAPVFAQGKGGTRHEALNALFDRFVKEGLDLSPEGVTSLGLDNGDRAYQKSQLGDRSLKATDKAFDLTVQQLKDLDAFGRHDLSAQDTVNYDTVRFGLVNQVDAGKRFAYAGRSAGTPYVFNQLSGTYHDLPDFLDSQHSIETKVDADAYVARLEAFSTALDQDCEQARHDAGLGVFGPDFVLDKTLKQLQALRDTPADKVVLVQSLVRRTKDKEKELIVEGFDNMTKDQRETEKFFKDHRMGDWNVGMQKGLRQYVGDTYDREREEMEQQLRKERQLSRRDFVSDMQREIFLDGDADREAAQIEAEEARLCLPTDDDYGEDDDGGALEYEDVNRDE